ncbi:MAG: nucleotidyltransferase family protein [Flavobacteriaceae bacterium]|nr:nucleotidyltransferase family protein [Flavobacteriaceae bacterium]
MLNIPNIAVIILAAGASTRIGTPKQLLRWKNTTLLGHAIITAKKLNTKDIIVILGNNYVLIKSKINNSGVQILNNKNWEKGLGNSIAFGVNNILENKSNIDGILIMLSDQPLIDSEYLNSLINKFIIGKHQIIATSYKNGKQGVPVLFDRIYFNELSKLNDDKGAKAIIEKYIKNVLVVNGEQIVPDIDTLENYKNLYNANHK